MSGAGGVTGSLPRRAVSSSSTAPGVVSGGEHPEEHLSSGNEGVQLCSSSMAPPRVLCSHPTAFPRQGINRAACLGGFSPQHLPQDSEDTASSCHLVLGHMRKLLPTPGAGRPFHHLFKLPQEPLDGHGRRRMHWNPPWKAPEVGQVS